MSIPFTQYLLPDGRRAETTTERPADIEALAEQFIASGGRYECEILRTGDVSLTAVAEVDGEEDDIEIIVCPNGPEIPGKVDELVRRSIAYLGCTDAERDDDDETPEPCTSAAHGCTCSMESVNSASIDPPLPIVDRDCPLHGDQRDPSDLYKAQRDDEEYFAFYTEDCA